MTNPTYARSPPAGFFFCPNITPKKEKIHMNDIFDNIETMKENEHSQFCFQAG